MRRTSISAVVLGGGTLEGDSVPKAFIPIEGRPLILPAIEAVRGSEAIRKPITVVTNPQHAERHGITRDARVVEPGQSLIESVRAGIADLPPHEPALVVCGDMPLIQANMVQDFIEQCEHRGQTDVWVGHVSEEQAWRALPGFPHTFATLMKQRYTMAGLMLLRPFVLTLPIVELLTKLRKNVLKLGWAIGPGLLLRYLGGHLSRSEAEVMLGKRLGAEIAGVETPHGELSVDIDSMEKLQKFQELRINATLSK